MSTIRKDILVRPVGEVEREWFTREAVAESLGVSVDWVKKLNYRGILRYTKLQGRVFIHKGDIDKLLWKGMVW